MAVTYLSIIEGNVSQPAPVLGVDCRFRWSTDKKTQYVCITDAPQSVIDSFVAIGWKIDSQKAFDLGKGYPWL